MFVRTRDLGIPTVLLALCLGGVANAQEGGAPPPSEVVVEKVAPKSIPLTREYPGRIAGFREVEVRAQVSGILLERAYNEGERVDKGQVLFRIDPRPYQAALAQAKGTLAQEQARLRQTDRDLKRIRQLQTKGYASASELDNAISSYEQTRANIQAAEAAVQARQIDLDYTTVESPISGVTSRETRSEGSLVTAGDPNTSLLTRVTQLDPVYANFAYPDQEAARLRMDVQTGVLSMPEDGKLNVEIRLNNGQAYPVEGQVDFTDSLIDRGTGTVSARAIVPNPEQTLLSGQFVRVALKGLVYPDAITVPESAVFQGPKGTFVYVVGSDNKAQPRPVTTGNTFDGRWMISDGLKAGDAVVVEGGMKVRPGATVKVVEPGQGGQKPAQGEGAGS